MWVVRAYSGAYSVAGATWCTRWGLTELEVDAASLPLPVTVAGRLGPGWAPELPRPSWRRWNRALHRLVGL
jgi:hypothetical protein